MASINKLSIRGVRAFSPEDDEQMVEFFFPCTIIVGQNGCGKTTIIECLKYAVTGGFPPNGTKGQSFVHDPRSIGQSTVKANVKLRFTSRSGQTMVVVRSMEVTQKKATLTFKQMDGVMRMLDPETGQRISLSHKCTELDKQVPGMLGVSRAILEHVVFCHQEESSWPLMEGAVLKKRFDEIFDATRYTKGLESLRKTEKDFLSKAKDLKTNVAELQAHQHAAKGFRGDLERLHEEMQELENRKSKIDKKVKELQQEEGTLTELVSQTETLTESIDQRQNELTSQQQLAAKQKQMLEDDLTAKHSEDELSAMLKDYDKKVASEKDRLTGLEQQHQGINAELDKLRVKENECSNQIGQLRAEQQANDKRIKQRFAAMEDLAQKHSVDLHVSQTQPSGSQSFVHGSQTQDDGTASGSQVTHVTPEDLKAFNKALDRKDAELEEALSDHRSRMQEQDDELQNHLTDLKSRLSSIERERHRAAQRRDEAKSEYEQLAKQSQSVSLSRAKADIDDARKKLKEASKNRDDMMEHARRNEIPVELRHCEEKIDNIKRINEDDKLLLDALRHTVESQNAIAVLEDQCERDLSFLEESLREKSYTLQNFNIEPIKSLPTLQEDERGTELAAKLSGLQDIVRARLDERKDELRRANDSLLKAQQQRSEKSALAANHRRQLHAASTRADALSASDGALTAYKQTVQDVVKFEQQKGNEGPPADASKDPLVMLGYLDQRLSEIEDDAPNEVNPAAVRLVLRTLKTIGNDKFECPCCCRAFTSEEEFGAFLGALKTLRHHESFAGPDENSIEAHRAAKEQFQQWRQTLSGVMNDVRDYYRLSEERESLEMDIQTLEQDMEAKKKLVDDEKDNVDDIQKDATELQELSEQVRAWVADGSRLTDRRIELQQKREDFNVGSLTNDRRDLRQVEEDIAKRSDEKDELSTRVSRLNKEMGVLNAKIANANQVASNMEKRVRELEQKCNDDERIFNRKNELKSELETLAREEKKLAEDTAPLTQKISRKESEKNKVRAMTRDEETRLSGALSRYRSDVSQLRDLCRQIDEYEESDTSQRSTAIEAKLERIAKKMGDSKTDLQNLVPQLDQVRSVVNDQERYKKLLQENIDLHGALKRIKKLQSQLATLEDELANFEGCDTAPARLAEIKQAREKHMSDRARIEGHWTGMHEQVMELKRKLKSEEYDNVDERLRHQVIDYETTVIAASDLKKYATALDKALLRFHGVKIAEINKIIRELWLLTYKGEDISNIELVSGQEEGSRASKSYNYRVVMTKGSSQLDMRGRCSAGQRVLASIVIRLALAETFCVHCGCIALDEPTVNLDHKNKRGLALALAQIVASRSQQRNFQLIMITHDEEFVSMMKTELSSLTGFSLPEKYFQVRREMASDGKYYSKINAVDWDNVV